ncbi:DNA recombination protein RmuC [Leucobacter musarum]|uniref:DNA recombination protein RmuC n=1 Tax=Leucobacter musarum TaxID=1930747 RepID=UPI0009EB9B94|nr:DNA recombination protein RmuC [Leucobacter musarum]
MAIATLILLGANLLLLVALLVVVFLRTGSRGATPASAFDGRGLAAEIRGDLSAQRGEIGQSLTGISDRVHAGAQATLTAQNSLRASVEARFEDLREANDAKLEQVRQAVGEQLQHRLKASLDENAGRVQALADTHVAKQAELQRVLRDELEKLREGNEAKLEKMRETVDEKLQGTLERRLGESFRLVSDRLEQVQKGLGEMQTLATDVGGLKRVLTNVKNRGSWGEVQLARQLEDMLTPEQYAENVAVRPSSAERVEFAVKLPGRGDLGDPVWLPIDSKFPQEDYERLLEAQERGDRAEIESASKTVERVILTQAKLIRDKYLEPPYTTDFGIMYLPTEGLFAEVIRRPGLTSKLQTEYHVTVAGPTVLMSLLNSLQLGFRTLAIEQRSSEVWQVLSAAKVEFQKYGQVWEKLGKQLATAQNTVSEAGRRTRAVEKRLRAVETFDTAGEGGAHALEEYVTEPAPEHDALAAARARAGADEDTVAEADAHTGLWEDR